MLYARRFLLTFPRTLCFNHAYNILVAPLKSAKSWVPGGAKHPIPL